MPLAPVEYAVIAFDGTSVTGEVAPAEVALSTHLSPTDAPTSQEPA